MVFMMKAMGFLIGAGFGASFLAGAAGGGGALPGRFRPDGAGAGAGVGCGAGAEGLGAALYDVVELEADICRGLACSRGG